MHFKVFSLKKCYKWICVFVICVLILTVSYAIKEKRDSKLQTEKLIQQVEIIENREEVEIKEVEEEEEVKEEKIIFPAKEPTLNIPKEYEGWDVIRKINNTKN